MDIRGKGAVVTGAASGIGQAVAYELARRGVRALALVDRSEAVRDVAEAIGRESAKQVCIESFVGDVTADDFRRRVYDQTIEHCGVPTICVPAAGVTRDALAVRLDKESGKASLYSIEHFRQVMEVNLVAPTYWALEFVARIAEDRNHRGLKAWDPEEHVQGTIIFIGSVSSQGNKGQISYAATKAGLEGMAATLMKEAIFHGIRCGVIHPGFTDTPMVRALGEEYITNRILKQTQLRRLIKPEEIADRKSVV